MRAYELIEGLQAMIDVHGDLEVLIETADEVRGLKPTIDRDRFEVDGQHYLVLTVEGVED